MNYIYNGYKSVWQLIRENNNNEDSMIAGQIYKFEQLRQINSSLINFTYRTGISDLRSEGRQLTDDRGWGCVFRVFQTCLANVLVKIKDLKDHDEKQIDKKRKNLVPIIQMFLDSKSSQFSISNMVAEMCKMGYKFQGKKWISLRLGAQIMSSLANSSKETMPKIVCFDHQIYVAQIQKNLEFGPVIVFVCFNLFNTKITDPDLKFLRLLFLIPQLQSACGGVKGDALYFYGMSRTKLIMTDPHYVFNSCKKEDLLKNEILKTFFNQKIQSIDISKLQRSMCACLLIRNKMQLGDMVKRISDLSFLEKITVDIRKQTDYFPRLSVI